MYKKALETSFDHKAWEEMKNKYLRGEGTQQQGPTLQSEITIEEVRTERVPRTTQTFGPVTRERAEAERAMEEVSTQPTALMDFPHFPDRSKDKK